MCLQFFSPPSLRLSFDSVYASFFFPCVNILNCVVRFRIHFLLWLLVFVLVEKDLSARLLKNFFSCTILMVIGNLYSFQLEGEHDFHLTGFWGLYFNVNNI